MASEESRCAGALAWGGISIVLRPCFSLDMRVNSEVGGKVGAFTVGSNIPIGHPEGSDVESGPSL
jgi:hypothetical protein